MRFTRSMAVLLPLVVACSAAEGVSADPPEESSSAVGSTEVVPVGTRYGTRSVDYAGCGADRGSSRVFAPGLAGDASAATYTFRRTERAVKLGPYGASYAIQIFDGASPVWNLGKEAGAPSPLVRLVTSDAASGGKNLDTCVFDGTSALIFAYGRGVPKGGDSLENLDERLLDALVRWNAVPTLPRGDGTPDKLKSAPGYFQIVHDDASADPSSASHSTSAIREMASDLELAFRAGVRDVEVVSHGEGMITAHLGYALFVERLSSDRRAAFETRANALGLAGVPKADDPEAVAKLETLLRGERPLALHFYHLQASPTATTTTVPDDDGFYGDFVPVTAERGKPVTDPPGGAPRADVDTYLRSVFPWVAPSFRFYYNTGDASTAGVSAPAGISRSTPWVRSVRPVAEATTGFVVGHFLCERDGIADLNDADTECRVGSGGGTEHDPRYALTAFSNPIRSLTWKRVE